MTDPTTRLEQEREEIAHRLASLRGDVDSIVDSVSSTTGDDEHDPEGVTIGFERAQAEALVEQAQAHLAEVNAALKRIAHGTYATCVRCGKPIAPERLEARPEAAQCITCASRRP
jgi:DnaK suppressor protein